MFKLLWIFFTDWFRDGISIIDLVIPPADTAPSSRVGKWMGFTNTLLCQFVSFPCLVLNTPLHTQDSNSLQTSPSWRVGLTCWWWWASPLPCFASFVNIPLSCFMHYSDICQVNFNRSRLGLLQQSTAMCIDVLVASCAAPLANAPGPPTAAPSCATV